MRNPRFELCKFCLLVILIALTSSSEGQTTLKLTDFAIWGGSATPTKYTSAQGIVLNNVTNIQGNIGTNHLIDVKNDLVLTGNVYSGNLISFKNNVKITGNVTANRAGTTSTPVISGANNINITGNVTANGKITIANLSKITGQVAIPAPTKTNYSGPVPTGGTTNSFTLPIMPAMPTNSPFDNQIGTTTITTTQTLSPGMYKKLALAGSKTITFNGPGNYVFYEVDNGGSSNKFIYDFRNTTAGTINIYVIKDACWGAILVSTKNGSFPSRIYTEVHGDGAKTGGNSFTLIGPSSMPAGSNMWLGNVWVPNGGISITNSPTIPAGSAHVIGALWSGKKVTIQNNFALIYQAPAATANLGTITPYYPFPANGKVAATNNKIGAELFSLTQNKDVITAIPDDQIFVINSGNVLIDVISKTPNNNALKSTLVGLGMLNESNAPGTFDNGPDINTITGYFPISKLTQLNSNTSIAFVRPLYPPIPNTGLVTSQGDITMRSNSVRSRFGLDGTGVKVGVISDSYDSKHQAQTDVDEDDLPGIKSNGQANDNPVPVQVVQDLTGQPGHDEGRAMLQIIHDIAPKATLAFHTGVLSAGQFAKAIQKLASDTLSGGKCDLIVDDLTYITEPFQQDGVVARAVDSAVAHGVTYFSAAGNFGTKSYEATFNGVSNPAVIPTGLIHKFGPNATDIFQDIDLKPGSYTIVLQWADQAGSLGQGVGTKTDLDLYIVGANGFTLFGFNRNNLLGDPFEVCPFTVTDEINAKLMIVKAKDTLNANPNVPFKYIIFRGDGTILNFPSLSSSTVVGHSNADSAITVGAMLYANIPPFTPVWPGVASFSSRGGTSTQVGTGTTFTARNKPELIGPNGGNTTVDLGGPQFNDGDTYPNFFGTSAAAPHVAGVAALLVQERKKYNLQAKVKPSEIRTQLQTSAGKFSYLPGNFSFEGGYGYVQADSAVAKLANAKPVISTLDPVTPGAQSGSQPFPIKITGKYLTTATKIYVSNVSVATSVSIDPTTGIGTATATVPAIPSGQDPPFQLFNTAKSLSGLDGGFSEALHFFSSGTRVIVKAVDKSRKYGQENPILTASVTVINGLDTLDISQTSLTLAGLRLDNLTLATSAVPFSSPRSYGISVARTTPLAPNDTLLTKYAFEFDPGVLTVEKMPLRITPDAKTVKYGDDLSGFTFSYVFDTSGVLSAGLVEQVKSIHKKSLADNGLIVLNGFNTLPSVPSLANMSAVASFQSILNARKFLVQNGELKPIAGDISLSQIGDQRFIIDASAQSILNYISDPTQSTMVPGFANEHARAFLGIKALTGGDAKAAVPGGQFQPMVNGQLLAMVNGQLQALVNGRIQGLIGGILTDAVDLTFQDGDLRVYINGIWQVVASAQIIVNVNGLDVTVSLSVANGQLVAIANGQQMTLVNGQLQALVNGQLLALVNGQLKAIVNGDLLPVINGQLTAIVNGALQPILNGQLVAIVNGQLMILDNGDLEIVDDLSLSNGQLKALVNGQLKALVNGQLKALVNGVVTDVPTTNFTIVNGQLQAIVNGQSVAYVNGQLLAIVNGQLKALVNGAGVVADGGVIQLTNGQLKAIVNGVQIPIANGQLQALVNGQLLAMVNGQLMAIVNGQLTFAVFENGQLQALVNGQLQALVNGQLKAIVNGDVVDVNSYTIENGQLEAIVNGETWVYPNGQLKALVNGQLQALVNNFDVSGSNNNANTLVLVDEDDLNQQSGDVGGMVSMNMITGLDAGFQTLIPGAFVNENFDVTYVPNTVTITRKPLFITANHQVKSFGDPNPTLTVNYSGFAYDETPNNLCQPLVIPPAIRSIDKLERRTTYSNVSVNGGSNVYTATPGEVITVTGNWTEDHFQNIIPGYVTFCPGCITQNYIGMTNGDFTGNQFDTCFDVTSLTAHAGSISTSFIMPTRPGVYYITQQSSWFFFCYQLGHLLQDQISADAIAVIFVNPSTGVTGNTTATDTSPEGNYPIIVGGCYFSPNYRIVFKDDTLVVNPGTLSIRSSRGQQETGPNIPKLYPNPASTVLRLDLKTGLQDAGAIQVFDDVGKLTLASTKKVGDGYYEIDVSRLQRGVYFVKTKTVTGVKVFKFVKM